MPLVTIESLKGTFTADEKRRLIEEITEMVVSIEGEAARQLTWVRIHEYEHGQWAIGGKPVHAADVQAFRSSTAGQDG